MVRLKMKDRKSAPAVRKKSSLEVCSVPSSREA